MFMSGEVFALDEALGPLRLDVSEKQDVVAASTELAPGVWLHGDPEARFEGTWASPAGRLCEITLDVQTGGRWLALHLTLPPLEADGLRWISLVMRVHAARPVALRPCLRSGTEDGFVDTFWDRHLLATPAERDHQALLTLAHHPDLPLQAPWRELVLFLPSAEDVSFALHDMRVLGL